MKEITRITTIEITHVVKVEDEVAEKFAENVADYDAQVADALRIEADADDVHAHTQLFIREDDNDERSGNPTIERGRTI